MNQLSTSPILSSSNQQNYLFPEKKQRLIFALKAGILFIPFIFIVILFSFQIIRISLTIILFETIGENTSTIYLTAFLFSLIFTGLFIAALIRILKDLTNNNFKKTLLLPIKSLVYLSPLALLIPITIFGGMLLLLYVGTLVQISLITLSFIFPASIIYFWFKNKKNLSIILYILILFIPSLYLFTQVYIYGCSPQDDICLAKKINQYHDCQKSNNPNSCIMKLAEQKSDESICLKLDYSIGRNTCLLTVAIKTNNINLCEKQNCEYWDTACPNECFAKVNAHLANVYGDASYCDKALNYGGKLINLPHCYSIIAIKKNNIKICDKLTSKNKKTCYLNYATYKQDCNVFQNTTEKNDCLIKVKNKYEINLNYY